MRITSYVTNGKFKTRNVEKLEPCKRTQTFITSVFISMTIRNSSNNLSKIAFQRSVKHGQSNYTSHTLDKGEQNMRQHIFMTQYHNGNLTYLICPRSAYYNDQSELR